MADKKKKFTKGGLVGLKQLDEKQFEEEVIRKGWLLPKPAPWNR